MVKVRPHHSQGRQFGIRTVGNPDNQSRKRRNGAWLIIDAQRGRAGWCCRPPTRSAPLEPLNNVSVCSHARRTPTLEGAQMSTDNAALAAAWVQAVGSVGAIFVGFGVLGWQRRAERRDVLRAAGRLAVLAMNAIEIRLSHETQREKADSEAEFMGFENIRAAMEALPVEKLPSGVIAEFAAFTNYVREAEHRLELLRGVDADKPAPLLTNEYSGLARHLPDSRGPLEASLMRLQTTSFKQFERLVSAMREEGVDLSRWRRGE